VSDEVRHKVQALLHRGDRTILLSLARVSDIDAAGVGELVRAYNMTVAANGFLRITQISGKARQLLDQVGLLDLLTTDYGSTSAGSRSISARRSIHRS